MNVILPTYHKLFMESTGAQYADIVRRSAMKSRETRRGRTILQREGVPVLFTLMEYRGWVLGHLGGDEAGVGRCEYCGALITVDSSSPDHKIPLRPGPNTLVNLAFACQPCNKRKGRITARRYKLLLVFLEDWPHEERTDLLDRLQKAVALAQQVRRAAARHHQQAQPLEGDTSVQRPEGDLFPQAEGAPRAHQLAPAKKQRGREANCDRPDDPTDW